MNTMTNAAIKAKAEAVATGEIKKEWLEDEQVNNFINALLEMTDGE